MYLFLYVAWYTFDFVFNMTCMCDSNNILIMCYRTYVSDYVYVIYVYHVINVYTRVSASGR